MLITVYFKNGFIIMLKLSLYNLNNKKESNYLLSIFFFLFHITLHV